MTNPKTSQVIDTQRDQLASAILDRQFARQPELAERYDAAMRAKCHQDTVYHLSYLSEAIAVDSPLLFADYIVWAKVLLGKLGIPAKELVVNLEVMRDTLRDTLPEYAHAIVESYIEAGLSKLPSASATIPSFIEDGAYLSDLAKAYLDALLRAERHVASHLITEAVADGVDVKDIYIHVFQRTQHEIGRLWQMNEINVAQEHFCTAATQLIMSQLYPYIFSTQKNGRRFVATCVGGELHEIGVRMVADFLEMEGWDTFYLGANAPAASIVQEVIRRDADILGISATMTFHVSQVVRLIEALRASEVCQDVKVIVGGYPFNIEPALWQQVGADGFAPDSRQAVTMASQLVNGEPSNGAS
jgi:methylmalonyl-CoA mutase cobalamin-binding domain/chain